MSEPQTAEIYQATGDYECAIEAYIAREQDPKLGEYDRGVLNLRLAECYGGLLNQSTSPADAEGIRELYRESLASALSYLEEGSEDAQKACAMLDQSETPL